MNMTQLNLIKIAEEFSKWLDDTSLKYEIDKNILQDIIKSFLVG